MSTHKICFHICARASVKSAQEPRYWPTALLAESFDTVECIDMQQRP